MIHRDYFTRYHDAWNQLLDAQQAVVSSHKTVSEKLSEPEERLLTAFHNFRGAQFDVYTMIMFRIDELEQTIHDLVQSLHGQKEEET